MKVILNGEEIYVPDRLTVDGLLSHLNIGRERVAVELNLDIVPKVRFGDAVLNDGDRVEIVSFVGGGSYNN